MSKRKGDLAVEVARRVTRLLLDIADEGGDPAGDHLTVALGAFAAGTSVMVAECHMLEGTLREDIVAAGRIATREDQIAAAMFAYRLIFHDKHQGSGLDSEDIRGALRLARADVEAMKAAGIWPFEPTKQ